MPLDISQIYKREVAIINKQRLTYMRQNEYVSIETVEAILGIDSGTMILSKIANASVHLGFRPLYEKNVRKLPLVGFRSAYPDYNYAGVREHMDT
jgi:hypothetical protein